MEHLYHACTTPGCPMENWILREDFDSEYRSRGQCVWICKRGHRNSVLPSADDIDEVNKNILLHPEHYSARCEYDTFPLRRFRLCAQCVGEGTLTFAVHESGCKQWPGSGSGHRHCFCFHCARPWGNNNGQCNHSQRCTDPGIQQVRRTADGQGGEKLEIGFIDAAAYIRWIQSGRSCPPTVFPSGRVQGETRQGQLGMEDRAALQTAMTEGTQ
uniref:Uncharacterized protein n=1 Tax=Alexandrium andersonii TaxID=327968 RepID=A0A7S2AML3_9DINO